MCRECWEFLFVIAGLAAIIVIVGCMEARSIRAEAHRVWQGLAGRPATSAKEFARGGCHGVPFQVVDIVRRIVAGISTESVYPAELQLDPALLQPHDHLVEDLGFGLDSLSFFKMVIALEKEFGVKLRQSAFEDAQTVQQVVLVVWKRLIAEGRASPGVKTDRLYDSDFF